MIQRATERVHTLLRWTERYFRTDMVYLFHGSFWLLLGYLFQVLMGIVLAAALANLMPKESYGTYQFILSMGAILSVFTLTGMATAIAQATARGIEGAFRYGVRTQLQWSLGISAASIALSIYYFLHANALLGEAFIVVGICQPFITACSQYKTYLQAKRHFRESVVLEAIQRVAPFIALLTVLSFTKNPLALASTYYISYAVSLIGIYLYITISDKLPVIQDASMVSYGKHLSIMESFSEIAQAIDKVLVWAFLGAAPTAAYALALLPIYHLQTIFGFLRQLAFPKLAMRPLAELRATLPHKVRLYGLASLAVVAAYIALAPFLYHFIFPAYPEAILYSQVLSLWVLAVPRSIIGQVFAAHAMKRELYLVNISVPAVRIVLMIAGIYFYGIWGMIAATLFSELYGAVLQWRLFRRISV